MQQTNVKQMEATVAALLAKAEELKQLIEKEKQKEDVWPNIDDVYYYIDSCGVIADSRWYGDEFDTARMEIGNVFRTEEDAENYVQKRLIQLELETLAKKAWEDNGKALDWMNSTQSKYHICFDHEQDYFRTSTNHHVQHIGQIFFPTVQSANDAVKEIGKDSLKLLFM